MKFKRIYKDISPVAWCCAHFPSTCPSHGFTQTELEAWFATIDHWRLIHRA